MYRAEEFEVRKIEMEDVRGACRQAGMLIEVAPGEYVDGGACAHYTRYIGEGADGNVEVEVEMATRRVDMYHLTFTSATN